MILPGRLHTAIVNAGVAIVGVSIGDPTNKATWVVQPPELQGAAQPIIAAFDLSAGADGAYLNQGAREAATVAVDADQTAFWKAIRGAAAVLVDELNVLRQWDMSFKAEVAAATSLADLKARVATLPTLPDRTLAQAKSAIQAKIVGGMVD